MTAATARHSTGKELSSEQLYWREVGETPPLSRATESEMFSRLRTGDAEAGEALVKANLRFVVSVARSYQGRGVPMADLVAEGNIGLMEAVSRFDVTRGTKFITYAVWWIRQSMQLAIASHRRIVRLPANQVGDLQAIVRERGALTQQLGREPDHGELADQCDVSVERVSRAVQAGQRDVFLDAPVDAEGELEQAFQFPSNEPGADEELESAQLQETLHECLGELDEREHHVVCAYFGVDAPEPMTLEDIGAGLGVTRERVRQIRNSALGKLRERHGELLAGFSSN